MYKMGHTMKRLWKVFILVGTLALTLSAGIVVHRHFFRPTVWLSTSSPSKAYTVELTGDKGRGGFLIHNVVRFNAIKNGHLLVKDGFVHSGDSFDISFELRFPEHAWLSENVLRFWSNPNYPVRAKPDLLMVSNTTDKRIEYLQIYADAYDMFLVFDVQPHSTVTLSFSHQSERPRFNCVGEFQDGSPVIYERAFTETKLDSPLRYCLSIDNNSTKIDILGDEGQCSSGQ
jgi:hypothetical protein